MMRLLQVSGLNSDNSVVSFVRHSAQMEHCTEVTHSDGVKLLIFSPSACIVVNLYCCVAGTVPRFVSFAVRCGFDVSCPVVSFLALLDRWSRGRGLWGRDWLWRVVLGWAVFGVVLRSAVLC